jgi:hypothetical protein
MNHRSHRGAFRRWCTAPLLTLTVVLALPALSLANGPVPPPSTRHALPVYTAFGGTYPFGSISGAFQRYTFTGRESSGHSAAGAPMFYRNRAYSPGLGRFGRRDPMRRRPETGWEKGGERTPPVWLDVLWRQASNAGGGVRWQGTAGRVRSQGATG